MMRSNNKILFIVLIVLIGGFVLSRVFRAPALESNLTENLLTVDTAKVTEIHVSPQEDRAMPVSLVRSGNTWQVTRGEKTAHADISQLKNALGSISKVRPDRVVSRKREKWGDYNVDSTGTHVSVLTGKEVSAEFWVGKTPRGDSYVRLEGEDEVYEVKETLNGIFNRDFNGWRDKIFLRVESGKVSKIAFQYNADSSFVLARQKTGWMIDGLKVDSSKVERYLNKFRSRTLSDFEEDFTQQAPPDLAITFSNDSATIATVKAWQKQGGKWVLTSSLQDGVYFSSNGPSLVSELFVGKNAFLSTSANSH